MTLMQAYDEHETNRDSLFKAISSIHSRKQKNEALFDSSSANFSKLTHHKNTKVAAAAERCVESEIRLKKIEGGT